MSILERDKIDIPDTHILVQAKVNLTPDVMVRSTRLQGVTSWVRASVRSN
jgi:hypothetical protein